MQNGKRALFSMPGRSSVSSSIRSLPRSTIPVLVAAVLSSYMTYLLLYPGRMQHHALQDTGDWPQDRQHAFGDSSSSHTAGPSSQQAVVIDGRTYASQDAAFQWVKAAGRRMRVALVNEAPYHLEIVAGLLQVLTAMPVDVTWYQAGQSTADGTLAPTELIDATGFAQLLGYLPYMRPSTDPPAPCDFAVLVSPEYFLQATKVGGGLHTQ
jgi:hypothetical protein